MPSAHPSNSSTSPLATYESGRGTLKVFDKDALEEFYETVRSDQTTISALPLLSVFEKHPKVSKVMITYFDECLKCIDNKLILAPSILFGVLSELLIIVLVKTSGDFLEDPNAVDTFEGKRGSGKISYVTTVLSKVKEKILETKSLSTEEEQYFRKSISIVRHLFDSIKLKRDEYVHPKPQMTLSQLPTPDVLLAQVSAFNPYAEVILNLIDIIGNLVSP